MKDGKQAKGPVGGFLLGIGFMAALYGLIVYAGEIETDIDKIATSISNKSNAQLALDSGSIQMLVETDNGVEAQQNNTMNTELYGKNIIAPADAMITKHFSNYCSPQAAGGGAGNKCPSDPLLQFGDVKVSSILSGTAYNPVRAEAAQDFLSNLLDPPNAHSVINFQANMPINADTVTADLNLKANFVQALSDEALLSIVRQPFAEMIAKRTVPGASGSSSVSEMQLMEEKAIRRIMSTKWVGELVKMQSSQVAQDQAQMQAYQVWMAYQQYRQMERIEALLAVLVLQNFRTGKINASSGQGPTQEQINKALQQAGQKSGVQTDTDGGGGGGGGE